MAKPRLNYQQKGRQQTPFRRAGEIGFMSPEEFDALPKDFENVLDELDRRERIENRVSRRQKEVPS